MLQVGAPKKIIPRVHPHQHPYSPNKRNHKPNKYLYLKGRPFLRLLKKGGSTKFSPLSFTPSNFVCICVWLVLTSWLRQTHDDPHHPSPWFPPQPCAPLQVFVKNSKHKYERSCMYDRWMICATLIDGDFFVHIVFYCID